MTLLLALVACHPQVDAPEGTPDAPATRIVLDLLPETVDFGEVGIGELGVQHLSIANSGQATVQLLAVQNSVEDLFLLSPTYLPIPTGAAADMTLTWLPRTSADLDTTLTLLFTNEDGSFWERLVPVVGVAGGPALGWPAEGVDFGTVSVGCEGEEVVWLTNEGTGDLVIENVRLAGQREFIASGQDEEFAPFPWLLAAGESREVFVHFEPSDESPASSVLEITSNDPLTPVAEVPLRGTGHIDGRNSIRMDVPERENVTVLFAMNQVAVNNGQFGRAFEGALPTLFELLKADGRHYRMAFLVNYQGTVEGGRLYIDETMSESASMAAYRAMVEGATGDLDTLLATLGQGIVENRSWLLDESAAWADSRLSLIGMNNDTEQSSGNGTVYVNQYRTYKSDAADIVVHAIGGDVPRGCNTGLGNAEPFSLFLDAATATGGTFLSICDPDYDGHMEKLALGILGDAAGFTLTGNPAPATIHVYVDGFEMTSGWTFEAGRNAVVFEPSRYPPAGSELRIDYLMATDCPDED